MLTYIHRIRYPVISCMPPLSLVRCLFPKFPCSNHSVLLLVSLILIAQAFSQGSLYVHHIRFLTSFQNIDDQAYHTNPPFPSREHFHHSSLETPRMVFGKAAVQVVPTYHPCLSVNKAHMFSSPSVVSQTKMCLLRQCSTWGTGNNMTQVRDVGD